MRDFEKRYDLPMDSLDGQRACYLSAFPGVPLQKHSAAETPLFRASDHRTKVVARLVRHQDRIDNVNDAV